MAKKIDLVKGAKDSLGITNRKIDESTISESIKQIEPIKPVRVKRKEKAVNVNMQVPESIQLKLDKTLRKIRELRPDGAKAGDFHLRRSTLGRVAIRLLLERIEKVDLSNIDNEETLLNRLRSMNQ